MSKFGDYVGYTRKAVFNDSDLTPDSKVLYYNLLNLYFKRPKLACITEGEAYRLLDIKWDEICDSNLLLQSIIPLMNKGYIGMGPVGVSLRVPPDIKKLADEEMQIVAKTKKHRVMKEDLF